ncbi:glutathione peroxidase [Mesoterricola sediminis]|uniref:Glutathione peroxidase n=1 Tax=Mesoterricola sediminis TaxID=2927980 RepID=A0AA48H2Z2_9BACT|nr:glutathione peroxidase [Mesoterricola sediminis]BDU75058.1 glutathione peroxidase [Mesoterricola sediminis]
MRAPILMSAALALAAVTPAHGKEPMSLHELTTRTLDGKPQNLAAYKGKAVLVVNVASECGFTPQYAGLEWLYETYRDRGLVVLGFPCNQFGGQEPGSPETIQAFCTTKFKVTFPMMEKVEVKGPGQSPVYAFLTRDAGVPKWNFTKYLVGKDGRVIRAFPSQVAPESKELKDAVEAALRD